MFKANKPIKAKKINVNPYPRVLAPVSNSWFSLNLDTVKLVAKKIRKTIFPECKKVWKERFMNIVYALLKSVRAEVFEIQMVKKPEEMDAILFTKFELMKKINKEDFDSPFIKKQMNARHHYYEQMFGLRSFIQNYNWCYKDMDEDAKTFMKLREKYKLYFKDYRMIKGQGNECINCHHPCCFGKTNICCYCCEFDKLEMYIKIANCLKTMGSYFLFYFYLSETDIAFLNDNWNILSQVFSRPLNCSAVELYVNQEYLFKVCLDSKIEKFEEEKKKAEEADEMYNLILAMNEEQEKEDKKNKEEEIDKVFKIYLEKEREKKNKRKKKEKKQKLVVRPTISDQEKLEKDLEAAALMKSMMEKQKEKDLANIGDKSLI